MRRYEINSILNIAAFKLSKEKRKNMKMHKRWV